MAGARPRPTPLALAIACHEAAHCVVAWWHGYRVLSASINPAARTGNFWFDDWREDAAWLSERRDCQAVVFLAGGIAHAKVPGHDLGWAECAEDHAKVQRLASGTRQFYYLSRRTIRLVERLWYWIEQLADQLLVSRRMDQSQIGAVLRSCPVHPKHKRKS